MRDTCERMRLPFEVLIQGPRGNRIVDSLRATESDEFEEFLPKSKNSRTTISIYKPSKADFCEIQPKTHNDITDSSEDYFDGNCAGKEDYMENNYRRVPRHADGGDSVSFALPAEVAVKTAPVKETAAAVPAAAAAVVAPAAINTAEIAAKIKAGLTELGTKLKINDANLDLTKVFAAAKLKHDEIKNTIDDTVGAPLNALLIKGKADAQSKVSVAHVKTKALIDGIVGKIQAAKIKDGVGGKIILADLIAKSKAFPLVTYTE